MEIRELTSEQQLRMESFAQDCIQRRLRTTPLTPPEWAVWEAAVRRCYEYAGISWPGVVVRVPSPLVGAFAAPIATVTIGNLQGRGMRHAFTRHRARWEHRWLSMWPDTAAAAGPLAKSRLAGAVRDAVHAAVVGAMDRPGHPQASRGPVRYDIGKAMVESVDYAIGDFPPYDPSDTAKNREFRERRRAGGLAVNMNKPVSDEVLWQLEWFLDSVVKGAVDLVVGGPVTDAVRDAVQATAKRKHGNLLHPVKHSLFHRWDCKFDGRLAWDYRQHPAHAFLRDVVKLHLDGDLWERSRTFEDAQSAGCWWPFVDFVMVCDVPTVLHLEPVDETWVSACLHCETGPAVAWADGWGVYRGFRGQLLRAHGLGCGPRTIGDGC